MKGIRQTWSLWSEELKPKWSAFIPTGCLKRINCDDWSNLAPPVSAFSERVTAQSRSLMKKRGIRTQTGQRTNAECVPLLTSGASVDSSLVKHDVVWTDTASSPARGDRLGATCTRRSRFKHFTPELQIIALEVSDLQMAFTFLFLSLSSMHCSYFWRTDSLLSDLSQANILQILPSVL